jgi:hypothetical protein
MTADNEPTWMARHRAGRGYSLIPDPDTRFPALDRDAAKAQRAQSRPPRVRRIEGYVAYDLHSLLEHESESDRARPGHWNG